MIPTRRGRRARRELFRRWGLPNAAPTAAEWHRSPLACFTTRRVLFVDDDRDGAPVCYWLPSRWALLLAWLRRRLRP